MAAYAVKFCQLGILANTRNTLCQLTLLLDRKQEICTYTHHKGALKLQALETGCQRATVLGQIEQVRRM